MAQSEPGKVKLIIQVYVKCTTREKNGKDLAGSHNPEFRIFFHFIKGGAVSHYFQKAVYASSHLSNDP